MPSYEYSPLKSISHRTTHFQKEIKIVLRASMKQRYYLPTVRTLFINKPFNLDGLAMNRPASGKSVLCQKSLPSEVKGGANQK